jgi:hypothetical protein
MDVFAGKFKLINAEQMDAGVIDVDPEYQREVVWTGKLMWIQLCVVKLLKM